MTAPKIAEWNACLPGSLNNCASIELVSVFGEQPNSFVANFSSWPTDYRITAWGFVDDTDLRFTILATEDMWYDHPNLLGWDGFIFKIGVEDFSEAIAGPFWGAEGYWGYWEGTGDINSLRLAWRGVSLDQNSTVECVQDFAGNSECTSDFARLTTFTPEISTLIMILTGVVVLTVIRKFFHKRG